MISVVNPVILISAAVQLVALGYALTRIGHLKTGKRWLPAAVGTLLLATLSYRLGVLVDITDITRLVITNTLHIVALATFCGLAAADLNREQSRVFIGLGGIWALVYGIASVITPPISNESGIVTALLSASPPELVVLGGFAVISVLVLALAFYVFYITHLPEVSNRALFWVFNSTVVLTGFALATSGSPVLAALGVLALTAGIAAATYSQVAYRIFDIRSTLGLVFQVVMLITMTAAAFFGALSVTNRLDITNPIEQTAIAAVLAIVIAALYTPVRELANFLVRRFLTGSATNPIEATKRYSQSLSRAVEIDELVNLSAHTLNEVLRVRRSGMLLISDSRKNSVELTAMKGGGFVDVKKRRVTIPAESPIYQQVIRKQKPITQFDIVFNPVYEAVDTEIGTYFQGLDMNGYAPIVMDNAIIGLLACGAKVNGTPLYNQDLDLLVALANQTGVALRNTRLVADLRHLNNSMQALNRNLGSANDRMGRLDSVKTDFVTIASHELRTPLAQVRGYTDIIDALNDQGMLDQDQTRGLVNNLRKATERMEELISAMLDVSQLDVNAMDLRFAQTSPESVLRMAIEPLTDPIKQRKLTLSARGLRGLPSIEADMQRLVQAFRNIITNAIKFTPDGGRIDIRAQHHEAGESNGDEVDYILVSISDTGIGVDQEHIELIFNKFYRAADPGLHSTGTYKFMGAGPGLGLTIAKGVIVGHGGKIWAESPGHNPETTPGSTFYVKLPLTPPEDARRVLPFQEDEDKEPRTATRSTQARPPRQEPMTQ